MGRGGGSLSLEETIRELSRAPHHDHGRRSGRLTTCVSRHSNVWYSLSCLSCVHSVRAHLTLKNHILAQKIQQTKIHWLQMTPHSFRTQHAASELLRLWPLRPCSLGPADWPEGPASRRHESAFEQCRHRKKRSACQFPASRPRRGPCEAGSSGGQAQRCTFAGEGVRSGCRRGDDGGRVHRGSGSGGGAPIVLAALRRCKRHVASALESLLRRTRRECGRT